MFTFMRDDLWKNHYHPGQLLSATLLAGMQNMKFAYQYEIKPYFKTILFQLKLL